MEVGFQWSLAEVVRDGAEEPGGEIAGDGGFAALISDQKEAEAFAGVVHDDAAVGEPHRDREILHAAAVAAENVFRRNEVKAHPDPMGHSGD